MKRRNKSGDEEGPEIFLHKIASCPYIRELEVEGSDRSEFLTEKRIAGVVAMRESVLNRFKHAPGLSMSRQQAAKTGLYFCRYYRVYRRDLFAEQEFKNPEEFRVRGCNVVVPQKNGFFYIHGSPAR